MTNEQFERASFIKKRLNEIGDPDYYIRTFKSRINKSPELTLTNITDKELGIKQLRLLNDKDTINTILDLARISLLEEKKRLEEEFDAL